MGVSVTGMSGLRSAVDRNNTELRAIRRLLTRLVEIAETDNEQEAP